MSEAKVSCILHVHHRGIQLRLAYSWTRPAILAAGKGRGECFLFLLFLHFHSFSWGWSGGAKVLCILHHWGVQLILAYSWARPAILVVGKGRGGMFLFLLFLHFHSCSSFFPVPLFHLLYSLLSLFSLSLGDDTKWPSRVDVSLNPNTIKINHSFSSFSPPLSFISCTVFSFCLLPFSGRWHKMTYKGWCVIKPQHNQSITSNVGILALLVPITTAADNIFIHLFYSFCIFHRK